LFASLEGAKVHCQNGWAPWPGWPTGSAPATDLAHPYLTYSYPTLSCFTLPYSTLTHHTLPCCTILIYFALPYVCSTLRIPYHSLHCFPSTLSYYCLAYSVFSLSAPLYLALCSQPYTLLSKLTPTPPQYVAPYSTRHILPHSELIYSTLFSILSYFELHALPHPALCPIKPYLSYPILLYSPHRAYFKESFHLLKISDDLFSFKKNFFKSLPFHLPKFLTTFF